MLQLSSHQVFLFTDAHVVQEGFLELINSKSGDGGGYSWYPSLLFTSPIA